MSLANKAKRIQELAIILDKFAFRLNRKHNIKVEYIDHAATKIVDIYEGILVNVIRPLLNNGSNAQEYKVVSGLEIATLLCEPILDEDLEYQKELTSLLAIEVAFQYGMQCLYDKSDDIPFSFEWNESITDIHEQHFYWLKYLSLSSPYSLPYISNAIFWQTFLALFIEFNPTRPALRVI